MKSLKSLRSIKVTTTYNYDSETQYVILSEDDTLYKKQVDYLKYDYELGDCIQQAIRYLIEIGFNIVCKVDKIYYTDIIVQNSFDDCLINEKEKQEKIKKAPWLE